MVRHLEAAIRSALEAVLAKSHSGVVTLIRHSLIALQKTPASSVRELFPEIAAVTGASPKALAVGLELREKGTLGGDLNAAYRIEIDDRRFEFAVSRDGLTAAQGQPDVTVTATAADLIAARLGTTAAERRAALRRVRFEGDAAAIDAMRRVFTLSGDPGLLVA